MRTRANLLLPHKPIRVRTCRRTLANYRIRSRALPLRRGTRSHGTPIQARIAEFLENCFCDFIGQPTPRPRPDCAASAPLLLRSYIKSTKRSRTKGCVAQTDTDKKQAGL